MTQSSNDPPKQSVGMAADQLAATDNQQPESLQQARRRQDITFAKEARRIIFDYARGIGQARDWTAYMKALTDLYAQDHSFRFKSGDSGQSVLFASDAKGSALDHWQRRVSEQIKTTYLGTHYVLSGFIFDADKSEVSYIVLRTREGKLLEQMLVEAQLIREAGRLRIKHAEIEVFSMS